MHYRKLEVNGQEWRFNIGKSFVDIRGPKGQKYVPQKWEVLGWTAEAFAKTDARDLPGVGPGDVRAFIERQR